jgi:hypothetical protein
LRAVSGCGRPVAPHRGNIQLREGVDHVRRGLVDLVGGGVLVPGRVDLVGADPAHVPGDLGRPEVHAVGERGHHVPAQGVSDLRIGTGGGAEMPRPAGQVGGAGQDVQQRALGQPVQHRSLQRDRRRPPLGTLAPRQHRPSTLQAQVSVGRVARIDLRGRLRQQRPVVRCQRLRVGRDADLGAELCDLVLALLPAHQLGVQVGVRVRADHRDVPGPQFRGQMGEHAHFQVPARQHPRTPPVAQRTSPHEPCEGVHVDRQDHVLAVALDGDALLDPLRAPVQIPVGLDQLQRVQHQPLRRRRLQLDRLHQCEQHRPVRSHSCR